MLSIFMLIWYGNILPSVFTSTTHVLHSQQDPKPFYNDKPLSFLLEYGQYYDLFHLFFNSSLLSYPSQSKNMSIADQYSIRNHSNYVERETTAHPTAYWNYSDAYNVQQLSTEEIILNNKFRYGPKPTDRFVAVIFHKDPWTHDDATVNFVGLEVDFPSDQRFFCRYRYPLPESMIADGLVIEGTVEKNINDGWNKLTPECYMYCPIPAAVRSQIVNEHHHHHNSSHHNNISHHHHIVLDFSMGKDQASSVTLISNIHVKRRHEVERRGPFNVSMVAYSDNLEDPMVLEYVVYYSLLGVDHIYIFDNSKRPQDLMSSQLRPFLDSNTVTIIYFPFSSTKSVHWAGTQRTSFNYFLQQWGYLYEFVGFIDIDEFVSISPKHFPHSLEDMHCGTLNRFLSKRVGNSAPGGMMDSVEMTCSENLKNNKYVGGNALITAASPWDNMSRSERVAVTTFCTTAGFFFKEQVVSHGKMFIKPAKNKWLTTPHRLTDYWVEWLHPKDDAVVMHFSGGLRYSKEMGQQRRWDGSTSMDTNLRNLTLHLLALANVNVANTKY